MLNKFFSVWNKKSEVSQLEYLEELIWAQSFSSIIYESYWLKKKNFAPGRWAMGYPALYILYRILNEMKPKYILELGLGQSTRMITQYSNFFKDVQHTVVEHDKDWIDFCKKDIYIGEHSKIVLLELEMRNFKDRKNIRMFKDFKDTFSKQSFDFICIDAPLGGDMKDYARVDVLNLMPQILKNSFVILLDDFGRSGEIHTGQAMEETLNSNGISYAKGVYSGLKKTLVLCSQDNRFFASL